MTPMTRALCLQALVRVESVIREERESEALDVLSIMCEQVSERLALIATEKTCPADLRETVGVRVRPPTLSWPQQCAAAGSSSWLPSQVCTLMWATARCDIPELKIVREQVRVRARAARFMHCCCCCCCVCVCVCVCVFVCVHYSPRACLVPWC